MNVYETKTMRERVEGNSYVGRGIVMGLTADGKKAVSAYFIMGRSENSRNRIFLEEGENVLIRPFDESKVEDPSLIIYYPLRKHENRLIVTNGDQTDTIYEFLKAGKTFEEALETRCFEPDGPNWTPRISGMFTFGDALTYKMSILKSADPEGSACSRYFYNYTALPGLGHFIHTYIQDGNPIPTFCGEPERVVIPDDIDAFTEEIWESLNADNRISLYVRYVDVETGAAENRMINKNA
ncbi:MAG: IMP cyclohydrolase [Emergencia sp.]